MPLSVVYKSLNFSVSHHVIEIVTDTYFSPWISACVFLTPHCRAGDHLAVTDRNSCSAEQLLTDTPSQDGNGPAS